jgi:hypothetical protein
MFLTRGISQQLIRMFPQSVDRTQDGVLGEPHGCTVRLGMKGSVLQFRLRQLGIAPPLASEHSLPCLACKPLEVPTCWPCASPLASLPWHCGARRYPPLPLSCWIPSDSCACSGPAGAGTRIAFPVGAEGEMARPAGSASSIACRRPIGASASATTALRCSGTRAR